MDMVFLLMWVDQCVQQGIITQKETGLDFSQLGSREFLEGVFERNRKLFGPRRKTGARKFRGPQWKGIGLFSLRDLGPGREKA